ncbi:hypothetical protein pipiens_017189, partial [Culex pipiens pipiens]
SLTIDAAKGLIKCEQDVGQSLKLRPVQRIGPIFFFRITSRYSTKWRLEEYNFCSSGSSSAGRAMQQENRLENRLEAGAVRSFRRDAGMTAGHEDRAV